MPVYSGYKNNINFKLFTGYQSRRREPSNSITVLIDILFLTFSGNGETQRQALFMRVRKCELFKYNRSVEWRSNPQSCL